ncbi:metallophosphoesterase [Flavobacterium sp.]|uniref:metallophosphoesterase n=1 Tax=Flavobacterium sp. TaxID=239 RepID=UPI0025DA7983|nr:metallophosphoesterase [Flavobacterium sp.]
MNRTLVIGDIHGGLRALHQIMERANVSKNDTLIFLGDYVDGWSESPQVLDYLIALNKKQHCIFIKGNHDELVYKWLADSKDNREWYKHGGESTVTAYAIVNATTKNSHIEFLKNLKNYHLDEQNRLFIHAGFTSMNGVAYEYFPRLFYWDRTLWETALCLDLSIPKNSFYYPKRLTLYNEIYIGHTPVTKINETIPVQKACIWNVDTGAAFKGSLTIMDVDSKEFWQSEPLSDLYFNEKGRN